MPSGAAMSRDNAVMITVLTIAGINETLLELYSHENKSQLRFGIPITRIYPIRNSSAPTVSTVASRTTRYKTSDQGRRLYEESFCLHVI